MSKKKHSLAPQIIVATGKAIAFILGGVAAIISALKL